MFTQGETAPCPRWTVSGVFDFQLGSPLSAEFALGCSMICLCDRHANTIGSNPELSVAPQHDQQFAGQGDGHDLADAALFSLGPGEEPLTQGAVRLKAQPSLGQLLQQLTQLWPAILADALFAIRPAALERCAGQSNDGDDGSSGTTPPKS